AAARRGGPQVPSAAVARRGVQSREELPVLVDEVDHREGRFGHFGDLVGEGVEVVERGVGPFTEVQPPQPLRAGRAVPVGGGQQHPAGGEGRHWWAPKAWSGAGAEVALIRCCTRVTSAPVPELAIRASHRTTGTSGPRSS